MPHEDLLIEACDELISQLNTAFKDCASTNDEETVKCVTEIIALANMAYSRVFPSLDDNNRALEKSYIESAMIKTDLCNEIATDALITLIKKLYCNVYGMPDQVCQNGGESQVYKSDRGGVILK